MSPARTSVHFNITTEGADAFVAAIREAVDKLSDLVFGLPNRGHVTMADIQRIRREWE